MLEWTKSHNKCFEVNVYRKPGLDPTDVSCLKAKEPEPSKIEGRTTGQSESPRTTASSMKMKSAKYMYSLLGQEL